MLVTARLITALLGLPLAALLAVLLGAAPNDGAPTAEAVRAQALAQGFGPLPPPAPVRSELVDLGRLLAFDKVLSGNHDISCMTCHHPTYGTGDGRRLSFGTGGRGLGPQRQQATGLIIGRNSPPLFNLHALPALFLDGRVAQMADGYHTPAGGELPRSMLATLEFGPLAALPLFPVLARDEMRGFGGNEFGGNELAALPSDDPGAIWAALMARLGRIPQYQHLFEAAYPDTPFEQMSFAHASNAIAAFLVADLSFTDAPWDRFLAGDETALSRSELAGAKSFLDLACAECHSGPALSDGEFHNVALAQFGPGLGDGPGGHDDYGRYRVTGDLADRYAFRTPGLRNVELTAPYGHAGQFADLAAFVAHYSESADRLRDYGADLAPDLRETLLDNTEAVLATRDELLDGVEFADTDVTALVTFLEALTDDDARDLGYLVPERVPSGLPVD